MTNLSDVLDRYWSLPGADVEPLGGGMNSETWSVRHHGRSYVAKRVAPAQVADLVRGSEIATQLARAGLVTGRPIPTVTGELVLRSRGIVLLEHVPGRELEGDTDDEQGWMAETLAQVHRAGFAGLGPKTSTFMADWLSQDLPGVREQPGLPAALAAVRAETDPLQVTWCAVHTDPSPEAFVRDDSTGVTGLIDWSGARQGPALYDVASAVMYLGGPEPAATFLRVYGDRGPLTRDELSLLDAFRRFRWGVQAAYFAWRTATGDLTGIASDAENRGGLERARRGLAELGVGTG